MSTLNNTFDNFIYKASNVQAETVVKEQFTLAKKLENESTLCFEPIINSYIYRVVDNKFELVADKKIVIEESDEIIVTDRNGKVVRIIKDPIGTGEERETIEVAVPGQEKVVKEFTTLYYTFQSSTQQSDLCRSLINTTQEFYLDRTLSTIFVFNNNVDRVFEDKQLTIPFNGEDKWYGVSRLRTTTLPDTIIQIAEDGRILNTFTCPLPNEESTDIFDVCIPSSETILFFENFNNLPLNESWKDTDTPIGGTPATLTIRLEV